MGNNNHDSYVKEELKEYLIEEIRFKIDSWAENKKKSRLEKLEGLAFSSLVIVDGNSNLPELMVIPKPLQNDKYLINIGGALHETIHYFLNNVRNYKEECESTNKFLKQIATHVQHWTKQPESLDTLSALKGLASSILETFDKDYILAPNPHRDNISEDTIPFYVGMGGKHSLKKNPNFKIEHNISGNLQKLLSQHKETNLN